RAEERTAEEARLPHLGSEGATVRRAEAQLGLRRICLALGTEADRRRRRRVPGGPLRPRRLRGGRLDQSLCRPGADGGAPLRAATPARSRGPTEGKGRQAPGGEGGAAGP